MSHEIEVVDLVRAHRGRRVLDGLGLRLPQGSSTALLGASGSGKTTLLRVIAGLDRPDAGQIRIDGADVTGVPAHRRGVGVVFQGHALFPHRDVTGNVAFGLEMADWPRARRQARAAEVLELVGLPGVGDRRIGSLSGGERQRVALARALAPEPRVLLLDEPFGALDRPRRDHLLVELADLFDHVGVTVLTVTHDPAEGATIGERLAVLASGRIGQVGSSDDVLDRPRTPEIARILGHRNLIEGTARPDGIDTAWGTLAAGSVPARGRVTVLVPPDAVSVGPGSISATVLGRAMRGERRVVRLRGPDGSVLEAPRADGDVATGDRVGVRIDAVRVHVMVSPEPGS